MQEPVIYLIDPDGNAFIGVPEGNIYDQNCAPGCDCDGLCVGVPANDNTDSITPQVLSARKLRSNPRLSDTEREYVRGISSVTLPGEDGYALDEAYLAEVAKGTAERYGSAFAQRFQDKFLAGQREHGGYLPGKSLEFLLNALEEEVLDAWAFAQAIRDKYLGQPDAV